MTTAEPRPWPSRRLPVVAAAGATVATFVADVLSPRAAAVSMFYAVPIILTGLVPSGRSTEVAAAVATALTMLGLWLSGGEITTIVIADRAVAIALFVAVAALVVHAKHQQAQRLAAQDNLARNEAKLRAVFDSLSEGVVLLDSQGRIVEANEAVRRLGHAPTELAGPDQDVRTRIVRPDGSPFPVEDQPSIVAVRTGQPVHNVELGVPTADGGLAWRLVNARPVFDDRRQVVGAVTSFFDITDRKRIEETLRSSEEQLASMFAVSSVGMAQADPITRRFVRVNPALCAITGYDEAELLAMTVDQLNHPDDRERDLELYRRLASGESVYAIDKRYLRKDGTTVWVHARGSVARAADGRPVRAFAFIEDITARRLAEEALRDLNASLERRVEARTVELQRRADQLRRLASDLTLAEQRTRESVSRTLHDGIQQLVFGARLQVSRLARGAARGAPLPAETLDRVCATLDEAIAAMRVLSMELSPPVLREAGLAAALVWLAGQMQEKHGLEATLSLDPEAEPESPDVRILIFESIRELLFNVVKHAAVRQATVSLAVEDAERLRVTVSDNGPGLDAEAVNAEAASPAGLGLFTIRERLALLGGRLEIVGARGDGTHVILVAPRRAADRRRPRGA